MTAIRPLRATFDPSQDRLTEAVSPDALHAILMDVGAVRYHNLHPFHRMLHGGMCSLDQVRAWALNRYCYQATIPRKDAAVLEGLQDRDLRRIWIQRIHDHDGLGADEGGIERWLKLTDALDLDREEVTSMRAALPATRFAVEAYVRFVRDNPGLIAISSCLTELFAPKIHAERISGMLESYDFIDETVMGYFRKRLVQAPRDVDFALTYVLEHATTVEQQQAVIDALIFKTDVLWVQLDALYAAYVAPAQIPPGAWQPQSGRTLR
ncbi:MAG: pyrroloquinoline-quinone synthase PqqC [Rhodospirillaceae bacterium]